MDGTNTVFMSWIRQKMTERRFILPKQNKAKEQKHRTNTHNRGFA